MNSVTKQLGIVKSLKMEMTSSWPTFHAHMPDGWKPIPQADFFFALYTDLFVKDEEASSEQEEVYVRKGSYLPLGINK
jgi:hypothetical protein